MGNVFGYVRAFKPQLRVCEYETYKAVYCGLCKKMNREFGLAARMTLSYDFTFLALMNMALGDFDISYRNERCIAHPLKKSPCLKTGKALDYPACAAVILIFHKLRDDRRDKDLKGRAAAAVLLPMLKKSYKKAAGKYPELAKQIELQMKRQFQIEKRGIPGIDRACDPSSEMMSQIASYISDDRELKPHLERFGYFLGRYVYLCDALDDLRKDCEKGGYNPLALHFGFEKGRNLSDKEFRQAADFTLESLNLTMAALADSYVKLPQKHFKSINDNIVYLGMKNTFALIYNEKFNKKLRTENR